AIGERLWEILSVRFGNLVSIYFTKAGQQEDVRNPFSTNSCASLVATMSAPNATSSTFAKPSFLIPVITCPRLAYRNWLAMDGATMAIVGLFLSIRLSFRELITSTMLDT